MRISLFALLLFLVNSSESDSVTGWSCVIKGRSPGSHNGMEENVATVEECKLLCEEDTQCHAISYNADGRCWKLDRTYNENYEATTKNRWVANYGMGYDCPPEDCAGVPGGSAVKDVCDVCGGDGSTCADCNGTPNGSAVDDVCGVCDGDGSTCADCAGTPNGSAVEDNCGVCNGDGSTCAVTAHYQLVFRQTLPYLYAQNELRLNAEDPSSDNYAILDELERFRREDGRFYFRMVWPGDDSVYEWSQTSNPVSESVEGYEAIHVPFTGQFWGGLEPSARALMDGSVNHSNWFYALGSHQFWRGGIPSYAKSTSDNQYPQQAVELYVADENVAQEVESQSLIMLPSGVVTKSLAIVGMLAIAYAAWGKMQPKVYANIETDSEI